MQAIRYWTLVALCIGACSNEGDARLRLSLAELRSHAALGSLPLKDLTITVSGPGMTAKSASLATTAETFEISVPSGKARQITLLARTAQDVPAYFGQLTTDLAPGNRDVVLPAYPVGQAVLTVTTPQGVTLPAGYAVTLTPSRTVAGLSSSIPLTASSVAVTLPVGATSLASTTFQHQGQTYRLRPVQGFTVTHGASQSIALVVEPDIELFYLTLDVRGLTGSVTVTLDGATTFTYTQDTTEIITSGPSGTSYALAITTQPSGTSLCTLAGGTGTLTADATAHVLCQSQVTPRFSVATQWMEYAHIPFEAPAEACDPENNFTFDSCIHGGDQRVIEVRDRSICQGVTVTDSLEAFDWTCATVNGHLQFTSQLKPTAGLRTLIDFTSLTWRPITVTVTDAAGARYTQPSTWWQNPIEPADDATLPNEGDVWVVQDDDANPQTTLGKAFLIDVSRVALVAEPGVKIAGSEGMVVQLQGDFQWLEADFDAIWEVVNLLNTRFARVWNSHIALTSSDGVVIESNDGPSHANRIEGVTVEDSQAGTGLTINYSMGNLVARGAYSGLSGMRIYGSAGNGGNVLRDLVINASYVTPALQVDAPLVHIENVQITGEEGLVLGPTAELASISGLAIDVISQGLSISSPSTVAWGVEVKSQAANCVRVNSEATALRVSELSAKNCGQLGLEVSATGGSYEGIEVSRAHGNGIELQPSANGNSFTDVRAYDNGFGVPEVGDDNNGRGIVVWSSGNYFARTRAVGNANGGIYVSSESDGGYDNSFLDIVTANNGYGANDAKGFELYYTTNSLVVGLTTVNNGTGLYASGGTSNLFLGITAANNLSPQTNISIAGYDTNAASLASVNSITGISFNDTSGSTRAYDIASLDNDMGIYTYYAETTFSGELRVGNDTDCSVMQEGGGEHQLADGTCYDIELYPPSGFPGESNATFTSGLTAEDAFVGAVSNDVANPVQVAGEWTRDFVDSDWTAFDNAFRAWTPADITEPFPSFAHRGLCNEDNTCSIFDWRIQAAGPLHAVLPAPTGDGVLVHRWYTNDSPTSQSDCDALPVGGAVFVDDEVDFCESYIILSALEISDDGVGNDNGLCEAAESCVEARNIGAYQGEGALTFSHTITGFPGGDVSMSTYSVTGVAP